MSYVRDIIARSRWSSLKQLNASLAIGTICFNDGTNNIVSCIDAYGVTASSYPSATLGYSPSATPVATDDPGIIYNPLSAWSNSDTIPNCTSSSSLRVTSTINSTISFNYTGEQFLFRFRQVISYTLDFPGPSIMIHTVTSPNGGVFSVIVDDFDTTDIIDTFSANNTYLPLCYPVQFPPFISSPPDLGLRNNHSITLIYTGPSPKAPSSTTSSNVQFDSFAIPESKLSATSGGSTVRKEKGGSILLTVVVSTIMIRCMSGIVEFLVRLQ